MAMRMISLILLLTGVSGFFQLQASAPNAAIEWNETTIDFGDVPFNEPITAEFTFSNAGLIPVLISEVKPSCGCTVADYPKQPITSGQDAKISVTFDAKTPGFFSKTVTVHANIDGGMVQLYIKGTVVK